MNGGSKLKRNYIPYDIITKHTSKNFMQMLKNLEDENADLKIFYYGSNKHYDDFIEKVNEDIIKGVQVVI